VTEYDLLFDTWAWWEYLHGTPSGNSLRQSYLEGSRFRIHTSAITLAELSARLHADNAVERIAWACGAVRRMSHVWDVTADIAQEAGPSRAALRKSSSAASIADALILVTARKAGARIVSADRAFKDLPGVLTS
jgi:predicted nucleic acid-binding protein